MASNLGRWMKYAKAKLDDTLSSANTELDQLEAERAAKVADKPWLTSEADAPTLDEVRARIEAQSQQARPDGPGGADRSSDHRRDAPADGDPGAADGRPSLAKPSGRDEAPPSTGGSGAGASTDDELRSDAEAAALSQAKVELEDRARQSAERLEQIRRELGVDSPPGPKA